MTDKLLTGNIWKQIAQSVSQQSKRVAAIAYVSDSEHLRLKPNDVLVCDASDGSIKAGNTAAKALKAYLDKGVRLYNHPNLHAKILVFGPHVLIGSCNLSSSSANRLREAALFTSRSTVRSQALALITMAKEASDEIDKEFVRRVSKIKVIKRPVPGGKRRKLRETLGNKVWIVKTHPLDDSRYKDEEDLVNRATKEVESKLESKDSEVAWIRWTGKHPFRVLAKEGDTMIEMTSLRGGKRTTVYGPVSVLKRQDQGKWTRFYYEWPDDLSELSWTDFERRIRKLGITSIKRGSNRELKSNEVALLETVWKDVAK